MNISDAIQILTQLLADNGDCEIYVAPIPGGSGKLLLVDDIELELGAVAEDGSMTRWIEIKHGPEVGGE